MSKYTAEQVFLRSEDVKYSEDFDLRLSPACAEEIYGMLRDYAAHLREREAAKATKADEPASPWLPIEQLPESDDLFWFLRRDNGDTIDGPRPPQYGGYDVEEWEYFAPCESPAVAPMLASARVPDEFDERKPKVPGYYLVRRFCLDDGEENRTACVEARLYDDGTGEDLRVNLHETNTDDEPHDWYRVEDLNSDFQWLMLAAAPKRGEG